MKTQSYFATVLVVCSLGQPMADDRTLYMEVAIGGGSSVNKAYFDRMADKATDVARRKDASPDSACGLSILRSGDISIELGIPKEVTTKAQLNKIAQMNADVFVVDQLSVCGPYVNFPAVAGCERPGPIIVEADAIAHLTLIHEAGHRAGLSHATSQPLCDNPGLASPSAFNNIMFCKRHPARRWLTTGDCSRLQNTTHFSAENADLELGQVPSSDAISSPETYTETQLILVDLFADGIDFAAIRALTESQLDGIRAEIEGDNPEFWEEAGYVLGVRGTVSDAESLVILAHRATNVASPAAYRARSGVAEAIGMFIAFHPDDTPSWLKDFVLRNASPAGAITLSMNSDEAPLLANRYAQAAALTGDLALAQGALDLFSAAQADPELTESIAARAVAAYGAIPESVLQGQVEQSADPMQLLRQLVVQNPIDPRVVDTLIDFGADVASGLIQDFTSQQFGSTATSPAAVNDRVQELLEQIPQQ